VAIIGFLRDIAGCIMTRSCTTDIYVIKTTNKDMPRIFQNNSWKRNTDAAVININERAKHARDLKQSEGQ
jgi:hypothetical protein